MLTLVEKILFALAVLVSLYFTYRGVMRIIGHISSGQGKPDWSLIWKRTGDVIVNSVFFQPVIRFRPAVSILHAFIGWGLLIYLLINLTDVIYAYTGFKLLHQLGRFGDLYRLLADFFGVAIMVGMASLAFRRYVLRPPQLSTRQTTLLNPKDGLGWIQTRWSSQSMQPFGCPLARSLHSCLTSLIQNIFIYFLRRSTLH